MEQIPCIYCKIGQLRLYILDHYACQVICTHCHRTFIFYAQSKSDALRTFYALQR